MCRQADIHHGQPGSRFVIYFSFAKTTTSLTRFKFNFHFKVARVRTGLPSRQVLGNELGECVSAITVLKSPLWAN